MVLERWLPPASTEPERLHAAIRYAVMGGGKRLRPLLVYGTARMLGLSAQDVDAVAAAIEIVHAYSLVHDDLPALDNDELRRGRPTVHVAFDVATAILVGDALQAHAYLVLATDETLRADAATRLQLILDLASASGAAGMAGGQALDVEMAVRRPDPAEVEELCWLKTGRMLEACILMPLRLAPAPSRKQHEALLRFGRHFGLAFQLADDLLDIDVPAGLSGKPAGSDQRNQKPTLALQLGRTAAHQRLDEWRTAAEQSLDTWGEAAGFLRWLCKTRFSLPGDGHVEQR